MSDELKRELTARATELGFARVGVSRAEKLVPEREHFEAWLAAGRHGDMKWMQDSAEVRLDPRHARMLASARSVVVLVTPYARAGGRGEARGPAPGRVARYALGRDYHNVVLKRARKLATWLRDRGHEARGMTDAEPVLERAWAARAGVGFIGKNCCLIVPGLGSHVLLATVVTSAELEPDAPIGERCGSCRLCLDACPTRAFVGPRELDARACISYLTIETTDPVPEALRAPIGDRIFGCDECQDVCPFNRTAPVDDAATEPFAPDPRWATHDAASYLAMDEDAFKHMAAGSPIQRPGREGMARNAALVLGNVGGRVHLPVLRQAAERDPSATVRDAATWAIAQISERDR